MLDCSRENKKGPKRGLIEVKSCGQHREKETIPGWWERRSGGKLAKGGLVGAPVFSKKKSKGRICEAEKSPKTPEPTRTNWYRGDGGKIKSYQLRDPASPTTRKEIKKRG